MGKKRFELVFEVDEVNEKLNISGTNEGFSGFELVGILECKKQDIIDQMTSRAKFNRTYKNPDGSTIEVEKVESEEN